MSIRKLTMTGLMTLGALGGGLLFASAPVFALQAYGTSSSFGSAGSGAGQLSSPSGVAVNSTTHDVYVADPGNVRVDQFDSSGSFIRAWGWGVADGLPGFETCTLSCLPGIPGSGPGQFNTPTAIAVDNSLGGPSSGDVYVADSSGNNLIDKFSASGEYLATITGPSGGTFAGAVRAVAVDATGNLWVEVASTFDEFDPAGGTITSWQEREHGTEPAIAVDPADNVYVPLAGNGDVAKYTSAGTRLSFAPTCQECTSGLAFDPSAGVLFSDQGTTVLESDPTGTPIQRFGSGNLTGGRGLAVDSSSGTAASGTVYVADAASEVIRVFPLLTLADVSVVASSNVKRTSITLNGKVTPDGIDANGLRFEYGLTNAYGTPVATSPPACPATETECLVTVNLTGLKVETTYHYRLDASNVNGTNNSQDVTFTTAPAVSGVSSGSASNVTPTSATITGALEPEGLETHYYCQYGLDTAYGSTSPAPPGTETRAASGSPATCALSALQPRRTYHFRLVATNSYGTTVGADQTLVTPSAPPSVDRQLTSVVRQTSAIMDAAVNANNEDTTYHFEYGLTASYGTSFASSDIGSGYGDINVGQSLAGLLPASTYHFRVVATNATGTSYGADQAFVTPPVAPPVVSTGGASGVSANEASVSGTVDPEGFQTAYEFDLGTDTGYGTRVSADAGGGFEAESMTLSLQGLAPGTTYHYRLVATNVWGTAYGADESFTTPGVPSASLTAPIAAVLVAVPAGVFPGQATTLTPKTGKPKAKGKPKKKKKRAKKKVKGAKRRHG
jgi:hypothetical protein